MTTYDRASAQVAGGEGKVPESHNGQSVKPAAPCFYCEDETMPSFHCERCGYVVPEPPALAASGAVSSVQFGDLSLSKVVPRHTRTERFRWVKRDFMQFGVFKEARLRKRSGLGAYDKCWWCKAPFADADMMALAQPEKGANRSLCQACAGQLEAT